MSSILGVAYVVGVVISICLGCHLYGRLSKDPFISETWEGPALAAIGGFAVFPIMNLVVSGVVGYHLLAAEEQRKKLLSEKKTQLDNEKKMPEALKAQHNEYNHDPALGFVNWAWDDTVETWKD